MTQYESLTNVQVLHVVDRATGGVPHAVQSFIRSTEDLAQHHLLVSAGADQAADWPINVKSVATLNRSLSARTAQIHRHAQDIGADVIHAHSSFPGFFARATARRSPTPVVYSPHCFGFERKDIPSWRRRVFRSVEANLVRRTSVLIACSARERRLAIEMGHPSDRVVLVPNIADSGTAVHEPTQVHGRLVVTGMGRLAPQKGAGYFADAVEELRRHVPTIDAVWIGGGDEEYISRLREAGVRVTGWLPHDEAATKLSESDLYLHSAEWEGFPLAVLEAHAAGVPVLVRSIGAFEDVIDAVTIEEVRGSGRELLRPDWSASNLSYWDEYLATNTVENQAQTLLRAYRRAIT